MIDPSFKLIARYNTYFCPHSYEVLLEDINYLPKFDLISEQTKLKIRDLLWEHYEWVNE